MPRKDAPSRRVSVPVPVLAGLVAVLLGCLLLTAWLLGRESGRRMARDPVPAAATSPAAVPAGPAAAPHPTTAPAPAPATPSPTAPVVPAPLPVASPRAATPTPVGQPAPASAEAAAVARYFEELEALSSARYWDDPEALAMSIVQEMAGGGTGGIERLRRVQAEVEGAVRGMSVPEPCREHHRRSLELFVAAGHLLQSLSEGAANGDLSGVMNATAEAERLQAGAAELRELEKSLRVRYGLPPAAS